MVSGSMAAAMVSVGAVPDSTCTVISLWGGVQYLRRNMTGTDSIPVLTVTTKH